MRKTLRTALGTVLGTVLVSAAMAGPATPALAEDCTVAPLPVTCTIPSGSSLVGTIRDAAAGGPAIDHALADVVDVLPSLPTECNDGLDNDGDGAADFPADEQCTSALDGTEAPVHVAAYGHVTIETDAAGRPRMTLTGVFARPETFTCRLETALVQVTCVQVYDTEFLYVCTHFVLTAKAFSAAKPLGPGSAKGYVACDSGASVSTAEVDSSQSIARTIAEADSFHPFVYLGTAGFVRCRAMGIGGADNATGHYTVDCFEPGVADPRG